MKHIIVRGTYRRGGKTLIANELRKQFPNILVSDNGDEGGKTDEQVYTNVRQRENCIVICITDNEEEFPINIKNDDPFFIINRSFYGDALPNHEIPLVWTRYPELVDISPLIEKIKPFLFTK